MFTVWVILLIIIASERLLSSSFYSIGFIGLVLILLLLLCLSFISSNLFVFYLILRGLWSLLCF